MSLYSVFGFFNISMGTAHQTEKGQHLKFILSHDENFDSFVVGTKAKILFQYRITSNRQPLENIQSFFFRLQTLEVKWTQP